MKKYITVKGSLDVSLPERSPLELSDYHDVESLIKKGFRIENCTPYFDITLHAWVITFEMSLLKA